MASYIYISPVMALTTATLMALLGAPVWFVVLSFFMAGSTAALVTALVIFLSARREKNAAADGAEDVFLPDSTANASRLGNGQKSTSSESLPACFIGIGHRSPHVSGHRPVAALDRRVRADESLPPIPRCKP